MSLAREQLKVATLGGTLAQEMARIEEERCSWRKALTETDLIGKQARELAENSAYAQVAKELKALQSPAVSLAKQYRDLLGPGSAIGSAYKAWQESERAQVEQMRKMFDPMAEIRKSVLGDGTTQRLVRELMDGSSMRNQMKEITEQALGLGSVAKMLAQQAEDSRAQTKKLFENLGVGSSIQSYLKDFEHANRQWNVPNEVLGIVGSFKELQDQLGKVALPTIDWGSAAALAQALGPEGIQEQLALLGIEPDGSMHEPKVVPEGGLLSRKQPDAMALVSLLLGILFFLYQEISSQRDKAKTEAFQTQTTATLQAQTQQIQNLTILIEKALVQAAQAPEERFVVRERTATVRSKPEHGAAVEGKLMPNEVVRAIDKDGKWVEVEYYHWLHEEYRTGWILKKYLERVPSNYTKASAHGRFER
ncbi:MAG: SH3 domain-containing protein [Proteobacteria bacterium]|nr:SH3 domain-containing protein [Pseudomonadota bacterium]